VEAATPLPFAQVRVRNGRLAIDNLVVEDETAARLAEEHAEPARFVVDAIGIGARVLDREQTAANADFVKAEFERAARELDAEFVERARRVAERLDEKVDEVFGPEHGHVTQALARHFGDESSVAVQHKVKTVVSEVAAQMREDLRKQFTSDSDANPLAGFQRALLGVLKQGADQQAEQARAMTAQLAAVEVRLAELKAEKEKLEEVAAEAERGTAKGRSYEEAVYEALDAIAGGQGDDCDAVGDVKGVGGKKGDVLIGIDACAGPSRGRIVIEAKNSKLSKKQALCDLDEAMATRDADYGIFVVPSDDKLPAKTHDLREFNGNKLFVVYDPEDGLRVGLEVAYKLARARVLMARGDAASVDPAAIRTEVERALSELENVRRVKSTLTQATTYINDAQKIIDGLAGNVRTHLGQIDGLLRPAEEQLEDATA
jgi:hypothetical protein